MNIDIGIFAFFRHLAGVSALLDWLIIFFAEYLGYILVAVLIYFIFSAKKDWRIRWYYAAIGFLSAILSRGILIDLIRFFYDRARPFSTLDFTPLIENGAASFPSGHMAFFFALVPLAFILNKKFGWWFAVAAVLMGIARITAGVHWPSDIIGGMGLGLLSFAVVWHILPKKFPNYETS